MSALLQNSNKGATTTMLAHIKLHAYLNKNTFSKATDKPPEENRLNWNNLMNKHGTKNNVREGHLSWPERENSEDPLVISERQKIREKFQEENDTENFRNANLYITPSCRKCKENGHFTHECMTANEHLEKNAKAQLTILKSDDDSNEDCLNEYQRSNKGKSVSVQNEISDQMTKIEQQKIQNKKISKPKKDKKEKKHKKDKKHKKEKKSKNDKIKKHKKHRGYSESD